MVARHQIVFPITPSVKHCTEQLSQQVFFITNLAHHIYNCSADCGHCMASQLPLRRCRPVYRATTSALDQATFPAMSVSALSHDASPEEHQCNHVSSSALLLHGAANVRRKKRKRPMNMFMLWSVHEHRKVAEQEPNADYIELSKHFGQMLRNGK